MVPLAIALLLWGRKQNLSPGKPMNHLGNCSIAYEIQERLNKIYLTLGLIYSPRFSLWPSPLSLPLLSYHHHHHHIVAPREPQAQNPNDQIIVIYFTTNFCFTQFYAWHFPLITWFRKSYCYSWLLLIILTFQREDKIYPSLIHAFIIPILSFLLPPLSLLCTWISLCLCF